MTVKTATRSARLVKKDVLAEPVVMIEVPDGEIVVKIDSTVVGFYFHTDGTLQTAPLGAQTFRFKIVQNPRNPALNVYLIYELQPVVYLNIKVVSSLPADACEVKLYGPDGSAQFA